MTCVLICACTTFVEVAEFGKLTLYLVFNETIITNVSLRNIEPERTCFLSCSEVEILKFELTFVVTKAV